MRAFLAIPCPESVIDPLVQLRDALNEDVDLRPVDSDKFHLTVKFLGETDTATLDSLTREFHSRLPTPGPLNLVLTGAGVFPDPGTPSVAWAGVEAQEGLFELQQSVETIAVEQGFDSENHEFRPHVTIGRFNNGERNREEILDWIQNHGESEFGSFQASDLLLYESELTPDGPVYHERKRWPL
jgi:2'-5' RNA ligase